MFVDSYYLGKLYHTVIDVSRFLLRLISLTPLSVKTAISAKFDLNFRDEVLQIVKKTEDMLKRIVLASQKPKQN